MLRRFTWLDAPLLLSPGALCIWCAYTTSNSNQEDVRASFPPMFLAAFLLYAGAYILIRLLAPRGSVRIVMLVWLTPLAVISLIAGGLSLAVGYFIFAFICAPIWGACVSLLTLPPPVRKQSPPVSA